MSFVVIGLTVFETSFVVAAVSEETGALAGGEGFGPGAAIVGLVVHDEVDFVLVDVAAVIEIESFD